jgi:hypothetical protein
MRLAAYPALLALVSGCSTHYTPAPGPRLSVVMSGGSLAYHKQGRTYPHGFFGAGLVEAVEEEPEAREAAEKYRDRSIAGFTATIGGVVCAAVGLGYLAARDRGSDGEEVGLVAGGSLLCLLGGVIAGTVLLATAQPYQWDAINIYNDRLERRLWAPRPPLPMPALPPTLPPPLPEEPPPEPPAPPESRPESPKDLQSDQAP